MGDSGGLLSIAQVAEIAGVSRQTVYNWLRAKKLERVITDDGRGVSRVALEGFLANYRKWTGSPGQGA